MARHTLEDELHRVVKLLQGLLEQQQRVFVLGEIIAHNDPRQILPMLDAALQHIAAGHTEYRILIECFHLAVEQGVIDYEQQAALYADAVELHQEDISRMLLPPKPQQGTQSSSKNTHGIAHPLGMRTWQARRVSGDQIDRFVLDPDPSVIENLLKNPYVNEQDVVRIVARRPNSEEIIAIVARSTRWQKRYSVRRAIVFNPYAGVDVALRQIPFLKRADLLALQSDPKVHAKVRESAAKLARHRPPRLVRQGMTDLANELNGSDKGSTEDKDSD